MVASKRYKIFLFILIVLSCFVFMGQSCEAPKEILYVIGGYGWKALFLDADGYIVTDGTGGIKSQYNLSNQLLGTSSQWVEYLSEQEEDKPYDCGRCHTTGYAEEGEAIDPEYYTGGSKWCYDCHILFPNHREVIEGYLQHGHYFMLNAVNENAPEHPFSQVPEPPEGYVFGSTPENEELFMLNGIQGSWTEPRVNCEACHGPYGENGLNHPMNDWDNWLTPRSACGKCHQRNEGSSTIEASSGLIKGYQQYTMWLASYHGDDHTDMTKPDCVVCHSAHASTIYDDQADGEGRHVYKNEHCLECHQGKTVGLNMQSLMCIDCHMPYAVKSASSTSLKGADGTNISVGDMRAHIWKINVSSESPDEFFSSDGMAVVVDSDGKVPGLTVNFVCQQCHSEGGIRPHGLPAANPYGFEQLRGFATQVHEE